MNFTKNVQLYYDAARQEVLLRMRLRDNALLLYLTIVAAILAASLSSENKDNTEISLIIPFIALGISILVSQHYQMAAIIGQYLTVELEQYLNNKSASYNKVPQWDSSKQFFEFAIKSSNSRVVGHIMIISVPCLLSLGINAKYAFKVILPFIVVWWLALICFILSIVTIMKARSIRSNIYEKRKKYINFLNKKESDIQEFITVIEKREKKDKEKEK